MSYESKRRRLMRTIEKDGVEALQSAMRFAQIKCVKLVSRGQDSPQAPGLPPRVLTDTLRTSIDVVTELDKDDPVGWLGVRKSPASGGGESAEGYALELELGTSFRPAHPYLRPTIKKHGKEIIKRFKKEFRLRFERRR